MAGDGKAKPPAKRAPRKAAAKAPAKRASRGKPKPPAPTPAERAKAAEQIASVSRRSVPRAPKRGPASGTTPTSPTGRAARRAATHSAEPAPPRPHMVAGRREDPRGRPVPRPRAEVQPRRRPQRRPDPARLGDDRSRPGRPRGRPRAAAVAAALGLPGSDGRRPQGGEGDAWTYSSGGRVTSASTRRSGTSSPAPTAALSRSTPPTSRRCTTRRWRRWTRRCLTSTRSNCPASAATRREGLHGPRHHPHDVRCERRPDWRGRPVRDAVERRRTSGSWRARCGAHTDALRLCPEHDQAIAETPPVLQCAQCEDDLPNPCRVELIRMP